MAYNILNSTFNPIDQDQCIGDTLDTFNVNFSALDLATYTLSATVKTLAANAGPDLSPFLVSGKVNYPSLSADVKSVVAKAWVNFSTTTATPVISSAYNIQSVTKSAYGSYGNVRFTITFSTPMNDNKYVVAGMGQSTNACFMIPFDSTPTNTSFQVIFANNTQVLDVSWGGLIIFGS